MTFLNKKKPLIFILGLAFALILYCYAEDQLSDGFSINKIIYPQFPSQKKWDISSQTLEEQAFLRIILEQRFKYLGKGSQCYAFLSEDGKYVLKLVKYKHLKLPYFYEQCPLPSMLEPYRQKKIQKRAQRLHATFDSYKIAYESLKEETGIIYLHINPTKHLKTYLLIEDRLGREYRIYLDEMQFLIQHKADLIFPTLCNLMESGKGLLAKQKLDQILDLFLSRCQKGIIDDDPTLNKNSGFALDRAIHIDTGRFRREELIKNKNFYKAHIIRSTLKLRHWLKDNYPELEDYFEERISKL